MVKSPATHKQKVFRVHVYTAHISLAEKESIYIFGISRTPPRKSVGQSQIPRTAPSHNGAWNLRKKLYFLGKKLHGKKTI